MKKDFTEHKCNICSEKKMLPKQQPSDHRRVKIEKENFVNVDGERKYKEESGYDLCASCTEKLIGWIKNNRAEHDTENETAKVAAGLEAVTTVFLGGEGGGGAINTEIQELENLRKSYKALWEVVRNWDTFPVGSWTVQGDRKVSLANTMLRTRNKDLLDEVRCRTCVHWVSEKPCGDEGTWDNFRIQGTNRCHIPLLEQETDPGTITFTHHEYGCSGYKEKIPGIFKKIKEAQELEAKGVPFQEKVDGFVKEFEEAGLLGQLSEREDGDV